MTIFVTGTDTGVGKTWVAAGLVRSLRAAGRHAVGYKPVASGDRADAEALWAASDRAAALETINPVWFKAPLAPLAAGIEEGRQVNPAVLVECCRKLEAEFQDVVVEGAGGWLVPIAADFSIANLAAAIGAPILLVARDRLGAINHTLLTCENLRSRGLECRAVVLNRVDPAEVVPSNLDLLRKLLPDVSVVPIERDDPVLHEIIAGRL